MSKSGKEKASTAQANRRPDTLERLLSHCATLSPDKTALTDPPNRNRLEGRSDNQPLQSYSFKSLDMIVSRLAAQLEALGLEAGDYVALQMPHFSETPILVLALMRARLVPCMIPLSWSLEEVSRSFTRLKPRALISCGQIEGVNYSENMRELAFSHMHVRFVLGVGYNIAEGVTDLSFAFDPNQAQSDIALAQNPKPVLRELALVTYIDPATPVPHNNGQILSTGLLHVLSLKLGSQDHILSAYPLSSIPGLAAHFYPWLMSGCGLTLHHPFDFAVLQNQIGTGIFSYFAAPEQVIDHLLKKGLAKMPKLAIVRRDSHLPQIQFDKTEITELYDLWNLGGLGSVPTTYEANQTNGLFPHGRICLPSDKHDRLCLAGAEIRHERLFIKGRIFPGASSLTTSLEWISLRKRLEDDWFDTGLTAFPGPDNSILLGGHSVDDLQQVAS